MLAALRSLDRWIRDGIAPPQASRLELTDDDPATIARDADGIAVVVASDHHIPDAAAIRVRPRSSGISLACGSQRL